MPKIMTRDEEHYVHFVSSIDDLNEAWWILGAINASPGNPLAAAAFRYALVAYARPYLKSRGDHRPSYQLDETFVPQAHRDLHRRLIAARDQIHAHSDLTVREAKLHVTKTPGGRWVGTVQNVIDGTEELRNIDAIIGLIGGTLRAMIAESERLKAMLPINS
jgi:hypothetical protein